MAPLMAILRKNLLDNKNTQINYFGSLPECFNAETLKKVYGYKFELRKVNHAEDVSAFNGSTVFVSQKDQFANFDLNDKIDFCINLYDQLGSIVLISAENNNYISEIQHVRRRETIAMTPADTLRALRYISDKNPITNDLVTDVDNKNRVLDSIREITGTSTIPLVSMRS